MNSFRITATISYLFTALLAGQAGISLEDALKRLRDAGLDSLPGGGAEILVDAVHQQVSPAKITTDQWFDVIETAQRLGMGTTATMVYGLGEWNC